MTSKVLVLGSLPIISRLLRGYDQFISKEDLNGGYVTEYILRAMQSKSIELVYIYALIDDIYKGCVENGISADIWDIEVFIRHLYLDIQLLDKRYKPDKSFITGLWIEFPSTCYLEYRTERIEACNTY